MNQKKTKLPTTKTSSPDSSAGLVGLKLRLSVEEAAKLKALADADGRSLNNYIVHRIIHQVLHNHEDEKKCQALLRGIQILCREPMKRHVRHAAQPH